MATKKTTKRKNEAGRLASLRIGVRQSIERDPEGRSERSREAAKELAKQRNEAALAKAKALRPLLIEVLALAEGNVRGACRELNRRKVETLGGGKAWGPGSLTNVLGRLEIDPAKFR
jgi:hypothetical protein